MKEHTPFEVYEEARHNGKQKRQCAFFNRLQIEPDPHPCSGINTDHHVLFRRENGSDKPENLIPLCEGHQKFVHSRDNWGDEQFDDLIDR